MSVSIADETWKQRFSTISNEAMEIFGASFFDRFGQRKWHPTDSDRIAAHKFHVELISRVATQSLGYSGGVERRALTSVFELFARARSLTQEESNCETFEIVVWYVLNTYVRPFTAKWHVRSETGELDALDGSDIFRAELQVIQKSLVALDGVLNAICNRNGIAASVEDSPIRQAIRSEMARLVGWRPMGEVIDEEQSDLSREEQERVDGRRQFYKVEQRKWAAGLALSGGGIRSATFSIGVMVALSKRGLLPQFDYLSTVSGGGYAGSFLTQLLGTAGSTGGLSLRATDLPFLRREGESELLQRIRHGASYLTSSAWERFVLTMAQAQGIFLTFVVVLSIVSVVAFGDYILRSQISSLIWREVALFSSIALVGLFLAVPLIRGWSGKSLAGESSWIPLLGALFLIPPVWVGLDGTHRLFDLLLTAINTNGPAGIAQLVILWTVVGSFLIVSGAAFARIGLARPIALSAISILALITAEATAYKMFQIVGFGTAAWFVVSLTLIAITLWAFLDINATSLHGFYRTKLAQAFLVDDKCLSAPPIKLSAIDSSRTLFPILSCALNVPGSADPKMRGRHADVMSFTPVAGGASLIGHTAIAEWESANPSLDLATAMALSGAAVSPQMGLRTKRYSSFWLTLLNLRLGAWLKNPNTPNRRVSRPSVRNLLHELLATADEKDAFVQISDGGHIENLGIYELLRRRCRFIVAVDGEQDERMAFHGLTNLQRLAYIDFGITIEADLEDLRLGDEGLSRSHFRLCRVKYPMGQFDQQEEIGYLVYLKLSLTGNEGEFIRRFKFDEPAFPHHSTTNQFFTEVQFEAYRTLGEHVGDKMFLGALTGLVDDGAIDIEDWFYGLGSSFLDPLR